LRSVRARAVHVSAGVSAPSTRYTGSGNRNSLFLNGNSGHASRRFVPGHMTFFMDITIPLDKKLIIFSHHSYHANVVSFRQKAGIGEP
jgi:hypothetical protein